MECSGCQVTRTNMFFTIRNETKFWIFLRQHGMYPLIPPMCPRCNKPCRLYDSKPNHYTCTRKSYPSRAPKKKTRRLTCNYAVSAIKGTFFEGSKLPITKIGRFVTDWLCQGQLRYENQYFESELNVSSETVVAWSNFCCDVCIINVVDTSMQLGGPGKVVEIDEIKFVNRTYRGNRTIEGSWVFGGFERESNKVFLVPVAVQSKESLLEVIKQWILPHTTIISYCWNVYNCLADEGFQHEMFENYKNFADGVVEVNPWNLERTWDFLTYKFPCVGRREFCSDGHLAEFLFCKKYPSHLDRYHPFFKSMRNVFPPHESQAIKDELGLASG